MSEKLGGRAEVVNAPAVELMKYLEMAIEEMENKKAEKQAEMYINYLSNIFSQQLQEKPSAEYTRAKKEFEALLTPDKKGNKKQPQIPKVYEWDFDESDIIEAGKAKEALIESGLIESD